MLGLGVGVEADVASGVSSIVPARLRFVLGRLGSADSKPRRVFRLYHGAFREGSGTGVDVEESGSSLAVTGVAGGSGFIFRDVFGPMSIDSSSV